MPKIFPTSDTSNIGICVPGSGSTRGFSAFMTNIIPNLNFLNAGAQFFPLFTYEENSSFGTLNFGDEESGQYRKIENISDAIQKEFTEKYKLKISKEDIFFYVYGILNSSEYKIRFSSDLRKMLPRIPFANDFWSFSKAGRTLADWHLNYDSLDPYPLLEDGEIDLGSDKLLDVAKMSFKKVGGKEDKTTVIYNGRIILRNIPPEAYEYVVNGKSPVEWVMDQYQVTNDKESSISNNPNHWGVEIGDPQYILMLLKRVINMSVKSVNLISQLPSINEIK
jgi:predicted helicase